MQDVGMYAAIELPERCRIVGGNDRQAAWAQVAVCGRRTHYYIGYPGAGRKNVLPTLPDLYESGALALVARSSLDVLQRNTPVQLAHLVPEIVEAVEELHKEQKIEAMWRPRWIDDDAGLGLRELSNYKDAAGFLVVMPRRFANEVFAFALRPGDPTWVRDVDDGNSSESVEPYQEIKRRISVGAENLEEAIQLGQVDTNPPGNLQCVAGWYSDFFDRDGYRKPSLVRPTAQAWQLRYPSYIRRDV